jgi:hypothetical protein
MPVGRGFFIERARQRQATKHGLLDALAGDSTRRLRESDTATTASRDHHYDVTIYGQTLARKQRVWGVSQDCILTRLECLALFIGICDAARGRKVLRPSEKTGLINQIRHFFSTNIAQHLANPRLDALRALATSIAMDRNLSAHDTYHAFEHLPRDLAVEAVRYVNAHLSTIDPLHGLPPISGSSRGDDGPRRPANDQNAPWSAETNIRRRYCS